MDSSKVVVAASILASDFMNLGSDIRSVVDAGVDWLHLDVMDGSFVTPISFGSQIVSQVRRSFPSIFLDVHLMVDKPEKQFAGFVEAGASSLTFHAEACTSCILSTLRYLKSYNIFAGVSLVPATPVSFLYNVLEYVDLVLVMMVEPGYGGQKLIPDCVQKIIDLVKIRREKKYKFKISVDGGISLDNVRLVYNAGADILVVGTSIFKVSKRNRKLIIDNFKNECGKL